MLRPLVVVPKTLAVASLKNFCGPLIQLRGERLLDLVLRAEEASKAASAAASAAATNPEGSGATEAAEAEARLAAANGPLGPPPRRFPGPPRPASALALDPTR